ncbi:MAG TPA: glycosyltransferase family 4 protein [Anaerolineales bacterium]|nr:glycosyltransferase family 4 protein [Anaerolineales bacterium]
MRLLYVADGRSPIVTPWLEYFSSQGHEVHLVSTRPCNPQVTLASLHVLPVTPGEGRMGGMNVGRSQARLALVTTARHWLGPLAVRRVAPGLSKIIHEVRPDLVHAMRIPFEGMLAAAARPSRPLLLSVWGNDFTLHAAGTPAMASATRRTLRHADGLHTDCQRDLRLALQWGWPETKPSMVIPGNGGVDRELFRPTEPSRPVRRTPPVSGSLERPLVVQPRGFRAYVRSDTFFRAIPMVWATFPRVEFAGVGMQGNPEIYRWKAKLDAGERLKAMPALDPAGMADLFRAAWVSVSPSVHDGTPNTLLEAMACGCLPIAGDLESIREWIVDGENGLLVDPTDPAHVARSILRSLREADFREEAGRRNRAIIEARADRRQGMQAADAMYRQLAS